MSEGRREAMAGTQPSPVELSFNWKSDSKCFGFYDPNGGDTKAEKQKLKPLPFKFLVLDVVHAVGGFDDKTDVGIWSPEFRVFSETVTARYNQGNEIAKGIWKDIKDQVVAKGGYMQVVAYIMLTNGVIAKVSLKGKAYFAFNEYVGKLGSRIYDEWVECKAFETGKKGSIEYTFPVFSSGGVVDAANDSIAEEKYKEVSLYLTSKLGSTEQDAPTDSAPEQSAPEARPTDLAADLAGDVDDLPF